MAVWGSGVKQYTKLLEKWATTSMEAVGKMGVSYITAHPNIEDREFRGHLSESFAWSTNTKQGGGTEGKVSVPSTPYTVNIGTQKAEAKVHDEGAPGAGIPFAFGKNGNPSSFAELVAKIKEWCYVRGFSFESDDEATHVATVISENISEGYQYAYPFWRESVEYIKIESVKLIQDNYRKLVKSAHIRNEDKR